MRRARRRSEREMLDLIVSAAEADERVRAVMLNGSRVNPNAPRDIFQDFEIIYFVTEVASFRDDPHWIDRFGERMMMQLPEEMQDPPSARDDLYTYLMQFTDGNRIDLTLFPVARLERLEVDSLSLLLLDKDDLFEPLDLPGESGYLPVPPTAKAYADCCNEFWWVCPYVAKGLWRQEITYARYMLDQVVRDQLMKMAAWYIGVRTRFSVNPGKFGKYLGRVLEPDLREMLLKTYADASIENTWDALFAMCALFRRMALNVAGQSGFEYPAMDDQKISAHLQHVHSLPRDAQEMY